jgi:hypothetical protein
MTIRRVLNVAWALAVEGLEPEGVEKLLGWLHEKPKTPEQIAEDERKEKAAQNRAAVADLSRAFALGR